MSSGVCADGHWAKEQQLIVDASKAGNCLSLINDARGFRPGKQPNATFIQVPIPLHYNILQGLE